MRKTLLISASVLVIWATPSWSWWPPGHGILTQAALLSLPDEMPAFFIAGRQGAVLGVFDPDVLRGTEVPEKRTHIRSSDGPEHYINLERLGGRELPARRYDLIKLCAKLDIQPNHVGLLPYALAEWTERLAAAFAMHRKWPDNEQVKQKCLLFAGYLGHYAQDACQPLHLTVDHHGRTQPDSTVVPSSIHQRVDGMIQFLKLDPRVLAEGQELGSVQDIMPAVVSQIKSGFAMVDTLYALHAGFPELVDVPGKSYTDLDPTWREVPEVRGFVEERAREATRFTAVLYQTAWHLSGKMLLPDWFDLEKIDFN
jgi:hypothetical protein